VGDWKLITAIEPARDNDPWAEADFSKYPGPVFVEVTVGEDFNWEFGDIPDWLDYEICELGMDCVFDLRDPVQFALENGLCIGQEFTLVVWKPDYYQDYWGEWDVEYQWLLWGITPVDPNQHLECWVEWLGRA
jgi:hypothetical protein